MGSEMCIRDSLLAQHHLSPSQTTKTPHASPRHSLLVGSHDSQLHGDHIEYACAIIAHARCHQHVPQPRQQPQLRLSILERVVPGNRAPSPDSIRGFPIATRSTGRIQAVIRCWDGHHFVHGGAPEQNNTTGNNHFRRHRHVNYTTKLTVKPLVI